MPLTLSDNEAYRWATIKAAARGLTAHQLARACNCLRPGIDFRGLSKTQIYREFAYGDLKARSGAELRAAINVLSTHPA